MNPTHSTQQFSTNQQTTPFFNQMFNQQPLGLLQLQQQTSRFFHQSQPVPAVPLGPASGSAYHNMMLQSMHQGNIPQQEHSSLSGQQPINQRTKPAPLRIPAKDSVNSRVLDQQVWSNFDYLSSSPTRSPSTINQSTVPTAPPSPSMIDFNSPHSPPSIGALHWRSKDDMTLEPMSPLIHSPLFASSLNPSASTTPVSYHRTLNSSQPSSATSTPFSSRSRYCVEFPDGPKLGFPESRMWDRRNNSDSSLSSSSSYHKETAGTSDGEELIDHAHPDIALPNLFNSPVLTNVTHSPYYTALSNAARPSAIALTNTIAAPLVTGSAGAMAMYEPGQTSSKSVYSPYLSPQSRTRSLRSTVLASMQERTISARLGNQIDMSSLAFDQPDEIKPPPAKSKRLRELARGQKRDRNASHDEMTDEEAVEMRDDEPYVPPAGGKNKSARGRARSTAVSKPKLPKPVAPVATGKLAKCEHCESLPVNPKYGTGRFCGPKCARTFSIKQRYEKAQALKAAPKVLAKPKRRPRARAARPVQSEHDEDVQAMEEDDDDVKEDDDEDLDGATAHAISDEDDQPGSVETEQ